MAVRCIYLLTSTKIDLEIEIEIDVPTDIMQDRNRAKNVQDGIIRSIQKGLYEEGVSFNIKKIYFRI